MSLEQQLKRIILLEKVIEKQIIEQKKTEQYFMKRLNDLTHRLNDVSQKLHIRGAFE